MRFKQPEQAGPAALAPVVERYRRGLDEMKMEYLKHPSGLSLAQKHSDLVDEVIAGLFTEALVRSGIPHTDVQDITAIALGGYGRRELCPSSDIDLMLLHRLRSKATVASIAEDLFYPLWDLGLQVGHGTRTVKESLRVASSDFEVQTSLLDARLICGDESLVRELSDGIGAQTRSRAGRRFLQNILAGNKRRHRQFGEAAYLLEPDIKEGEGGLRDINAIHWAAQGLFGTPSLPGLVERGYLSEFDADRLAQAHEFMLTVRNHLHYTTERKTDRLFFEHQVEVAKALGFPRNVQGIEAFMRSFYTHARAVERISRSFWGQLKHKLLASPRAARRVPARAPEPGLIVCEGKISLASARAIAEHPGLEVALFRSALEDELTVDYRKLDLIREGLRISTTPEVWPKRLQDDFMALLRAGETALPALKTMDHLGILARYIPEWSHVVCLPQHDSYHLYTVDMHLFLTVAELQKIGAGAYDATMPQLKGLYGSIERTDLLLVAGLLHDIGKGSGKGHARRGARIAKDACVRMGFSPKDARHVAFLVENHLLLTDTATRRDLNDENVITGLAAKVVSEEALAMLYLLTIADSLATGPKAWDLWKDNLLRELFSKVQHVIKSGEYTSKKSIEQIRKTASAVRASLKGRYGKDEVEGFLAQVPLSYLLGQTSSDIVEHFELMRRAAGDIAVAARRKGGVCELALVAKDRPGLFYRITGVLALNGINILGAQIYTHGDGTALDIFKVEGYFESEIGEETLEKIRGDLTRALEGKLALEYRVAEKAKRYKRDGAIQRAAQVEVDNVSSDFYTIIEVHAQDRIGLLYNITRVMHDLNLDIHLAKVSTNVDKVIDVFYVWDTYGQKIYDEEQVSEIKKAILMALE